MFIAHAVVKTTMETGKDHTEMFFHREMAEAHHGSSTFLSDFILGSQDGLVNVLGIVLGISAATNNVLLIYVASLAALGAESISMAAVAYTSTSARRKQYLKEQAQEKKEMKEVPHIERQEVRDIFKSWGYKGKELEMLTDHIVSNPKAWLEMMMSFELHLSPVSASAPKRSFFTVLIATVVGSVIPLLPFILFQNNILAGDIGAIALSAITLFVIGYYIAKSTLGSVLHNGIEMVVIGLAAGLAGYLIGRAFGTVV